MEFTFFSSFCEPSGLVGQKQTRDANGIRGETRARLEEKEETGVVVMLTYASPNSHPSDDGPLDISSQSTA